MAHNPNTHHEENMPKIDDEGREIVRVATGKDTFRYAHKDQMQKGDKEYDGPVAEQTEDEPAKEGWGA